MIRVLIVDDHAVVREGLRAFLELQDGLEVIGEAADGHQAVDQAEQLRPDVILMDLVMPKLDGVAAMRELRARASGLCQPHYVLDIPGGYAKVPLAPCDAERNGSAWNGTVSDGSAWVGRYWNNSAWNGAVWDGSAWDGRYWNNGAWNGTAWTGRYWNCSQWD